MRVAIMQPYFVPYPGYFRLITNVDLFVIYDCVQFPRRGYVHRNQYPMNGKGKWFTLPIKKAPRDASINSLVFRSDSIENVRGQLATLIDQSGIEPDLQQQQYLDIVKNASGDVVDYLQRTLLATLDYLQMPAPGILRSSTLRLDKAYKGEDRILQIVQELGATEYLNAPGGKSLYHKARFAERGIRLTFLNDYQGDYWSVLYQILVKSQQDLALAIV